MHTFADDRGFSLMSLFDHVEALPGQFNISTMFSGVVKAWHRHALQDDHWVCVNGLLKIGLFNSESRALTAEVRLAGSRPGLDAPTRIEVPPNSGKAVFLGDRRPGVLHIPAGLWHGGVAVGGGDAMLLYYVTRKYDAARPDEERHPWDGFPFRWEAEFK